jgi:hypothetical protein
MPQTARPPGPVCFVTCNIVMDTCEATGEILHQIVKSQPSADVWLEREKEFYNLWHFCRCIRSVDGEIRFKYPPRADASTLTTRKLVKLATFWDIAPCLLVQLDRRFRDATCESLKSHKGTCIELGLLLMLITNL